MAIINNSFKFNPHNPLDWEHQAYEHFKMQWMLSHGYTLYDLLNIIGECMTEFSEDLDEAIDNFERNIGFGGELWPCFGEFMDCEYYEYGYDKEDS